MVTKKLWENKKEWGFFNIVFVDLSLVKFVRLELCTFFFFHVLIHNIRKIGTFFFFGNQMGYLMEVDVDSLHI